VAYTSLYDYNNTAQKRHHEHKNNTDSKGQQRMKRVGECRIGAKMMTTASCLIGTSSQVDLFGSSSSCSPFLHFVLCLSATAAANGLLREEDGFFHWSRPHLVVAPRLTDHGRYENGKPIDENLGNRDKCCDLFKV